MQFHKYIIFLISSLMLSACAMDSSNDFDSDGDGMLDKKDACPFDPNKFVDAGACGCGNIERVINGEVRCIYNTAGDSDNDGVVDKQDACPNKSFKYQPGICGCDRYDLDEDGDGAIDACEVLPEDDDTPFTPPTFPDLCPKNGQKILPGTCGCDIEDLDIDNDNYTDGCGDANSQILIFPDRCVHDSQKHEPGICGCGLPDTDSDGDTVYDCFDGCPTDPTKIAPLFCGCNVPDNDTDKDGTPDCIDACPDDPNKIITKGFCGCGVPETDSDNDGTPDCIDECPKDANKTYPGVCGCFFSEADLNDDGSPDCEEKLCPDDTLKTGQEPGICGCDTADDDSDDDGVVDCIDVCPNNPDKSIDSGVCGCDLNDIDSDGDGVLDCIDKCQDDPDKIDPMQCGCGNDEYDLDGDGTADCVDECPDDPTQSVKGECGCGLHPILESVINAKGEETTISICPAPGGMLSLDRMYPGTNINESPDRIGAMQRYNQRTSPNHVLEAYFVPGGNVLIDPNLESFNNWDCSDSDAWQCSDSRYSIYHFYSPFTDEASDPRPFPQHRIVVGSHYQTDDGVIKQDILNPYFLSQDVTVRYGVFGSTTYKHGTDSLAINNKSFTCDQNVFRFFTTTETLSSDQMSFTAAFYTYQGSRDTSDGSNANGAAIQGFQVFFGDPQVRFSTDGEHWTDWMTENDDMWKTHITLPEGYGYRYAYMQTRNATLPVSVEGEDPASNVSNDYVYYETGNRILLKDPNHDAHLQINTFKPSEDLDDLAAINAALDARSTSSKSVTLLYTPGTNMLNDPTFKNTKASKWIVQNAESIYTLTTNTLRAFSRLPELVAAKGTASFTQRQPIAKSLQSQPFEVSFWVLQNSGDTFNAQLEMYDKNGIILDYGIKKISSCQSFGNNTNIKYCSLKSTFLDDVYSFILNIQSNSTNETGPRFQAFRVGAGNTVVRFSNDRQTWSNWESANGRKNWTLDHCTPIEDSTSETCTVIMQSYDIVTRTYSEASDTILYTP